MDFESNINTNNTINTTNKINKKEEQSHLNYLKKIKKQAKRLLQYTNSQKELNNIPININNLSEAQELLAKINGYPNWHALEKNVTEKKELKEINYSSNLIENNHFLLTKKLDKYYISTNETENTISSFFNINRIEEESFISFMSYLNKIISKINFQFNMGFHNIELLVTNTDENNVQKTPPSSLTYNLINLAKEWNISQEFANKLFKIQYTPIINKEKDKEQKNKDFNIVLVASTDKDMIEEHSRFCEIIEKAFQPIHQEKNDLECKSFLFFNEYQMLVQRHAKKELYKLSDNELSEEGFNIKLWQKLESKIWIQALSLISQRDYEWDIHLNIRNKQIQLYYEIKNDDTTNLKNKKYLDGLFKNIMTTNGSNIDIQMFSYKEKIANDINQLPWKDGLAMTSIIDGSLNYYKNNSNMRTLNVDFIYSKPGSNKSLLMNANKLTTILNSDINNLPYLMSIDVGNNSSGLMSLLKNLLPKEKHNLLKSYDMDMTEEFCINPFDTPLGCRFPNEEQKLSLQNFLALLLIDPNSRELPIGAFSFIEILIEQAYKTTSDFFSPKRYNKGINKKIDEIIKNNNIIDNKSTWWEVVDYLFINNYIQEAILAQRYAVPLLSDIMEVTRTEEINNAYSIIRIDSGEHLIRYFNRLITSAINQYKILGSPTVFDIGEKRIVSLNLDRVIKTGKPNRNQASLMYFLANFILTKDFKMNSIMSNELFNNSYNSIPNNIPIEKYKKYYEKIIKENEIKEHIIYLDEFHRAGDNQIVNNQIVSDMRDSRKFSINMVLSSQSINDLNSTMLSFTTGIFIMDDISTKDIDLVANILNLNDFEQKAVKQSDINDFKVNKSGVFLAKFTTNSGKKTNLLSLNLNSYLLWCLTTNTEENKIKEGLLNYLTLEKSLDILVKKYPHGIREEITQRKKLLNNEDISDDQMISILIEELIK